MTAKASPPVAEPTTPIDLSHIRVGPPFLSHVKQNCGDGCGKPTLEKTCAIVENTRSGKKRAYLEECLQLRPELLARREQAGDEGFLSA